MTTMSKSCEFVLLQFVPRSFHRRFDVAAAVAAVGSEQIAPKMVESHGGP